MRILDKNTVDFEESELNSVYDVLLPKEAIPYAFDKDTDKTNLRDLLESELCDLPGKWSNEPWDNIATFKQAVLDLKLVKNSSYSPYQIHNYKKCYWMNAKGVIHQSCDKTDIYKSRISCGEKSCLRCDKNKRRRQGLEAVKDIKALFRGMPGAPGVLFLTFTLPEHLEKLPLKDLDLEKKLKNKIHGIVKKLFGLKTRSNIGMRLAVHAIGSKDVMRDRWHCHVDIVPAEIIKEGDTKKFNWLEPVKVRQGSQDPWILDLSWLKNEWEKALLALCLKPGDKLANPQVEFLKYTRDENENDSFYKKLTHKLTYNLRSFAKDFENSFLRSDYENHRMILKGSKDRVGYWYNLLAGDVAERFLYVRSKTLFRKRGFLSCLKKYESSINLIYEPGEPVKECYPGVEAEITTVYKKEYNHETRSFAIIQQEIWQWICPATGQMQIAYGENLKKWKGG